jgi:hypothetical protein
MLFLFIHPARVIRPDSAPSKNMVDMGALRQEKECPAGNFPMV